MDKLLSLFDDMTEGEPAPSQSALDAVIQKYGIEALDKMCDGVIDADPAAEELWSVVRWELTE